MSNPLTETGLGPIGKMPWGTHFCLFHQTRSDLLDTLCSYFRTGIANKEFCLWVASAELPEPEVWSALRKAIPEIDQHAAAGAIEVLSHDQWFFHGGIFDIQKVMDLLTTKFQQAGRKGFGGMRLNGSTAWLQKRSGADFEAFERALDETIAGHPVIILCNFPLDGSKAGELLGAAHTHHFTVAVRDKSTEIIEALKAPPREQSLTRREIEVLTWAARGKSAWEIGQILGIAKRTVDEYVQTAANKLGAVNRTQAVALALLRRILHPDL